jgi:hypothetical protein
MNKESFVISDFHSLFMIYPSYWLPGLVCIATDILTNKASAIISEQVKPKSQYNVKTSPLNM